MSKAASRALRSDTQCQRITASRQSAPTLCIAPRCARRALSGTRRKACVRFILPGAFAAACEETRMHSGIFEHT